MRGACSSLELYEPDRKTPAVAVLDSDYHLILNSFLGQKGTATIGIIRMRVMRTRSCNTLLCGARHATITIFGQCLITGNHG
jgi:hypothetical protein